MKSCNAIRIFVNRHPFDFEHPKQTGRSIKEKAAISLCDILLTKQKYLKREDQPIEDKVKGYHVIQNEEVVYLKAGQRFKTRSDCSHVEVKINQQNYQFVDACITGRELKERAGIDLLDVLFRSHPTEDEVIPNDAEVRLKENDCFYSAPPANYGELDFTPADVGSSEFECIKQPNGWIFLLIPNFPIPSGFSHDKAKILIKLPPGFPDASPDMFWVMPHLKTKSGNIPQGTCFEPLLNQQWQRFSWHLKPGAWQPGVSTLRDFVRCITSRFDKKN